TPAVCPLRVPSASCLPLSASCFPPSSPFALAPKRVYSTAAMATTQFESVAPDGLAARLPATVLVVDDEPNNLEIIQGFLNLEGYTVVTAEDGAAALECLAAAAPDLILLDIRMPGMDGYEVCRQIKQDPATAFLPVVFLTALQGSQERVRGA